MGTPSRPPNAAKNSCVTTASDFLCIATHLFRRAQMRTARARIARDLLVARTQRTAREHANLRRAPAHTYRHFGRTHTGGARVAQELLHHAVFERVITDDDETPAG